MNAPDSTLAVGEVVDAGTRRLHVSERDVDAVARARSSSAWDCSSASCASPPSSLHSVPSTRKGSGLPANTSSRRRCNRPCAASAVTAGKDRAKPPRPMRAALSSVRILARSSAATRVNRRSADSLPWRRNRPRRSSISSRSRDSACSCRRA